MRRPEEVKTMNRKQTVKKVKTGRRMDAMVTRSEAEKWLRDLLKAKSDIDNQWEAMRLLVGAEVESPFGTAVWRPIELLIEVVAELIDDQSGSLSWFVWDNEMGVKRLEHSLPEGGMREVETVHDLLDVLGY